MPLYRGSVVRGQAKVIIQMQSTAIPLGIAAETNPLTQLAGLQLLGLLHSYKDCSMTTTTKRLLAASALLALATQLHAEPEFLNSGSVLPTNLPFSEAVVVGETVYLSGQIGNMPGTLTLAEGGIAGETKQVMENIKTSLNAHGLGLENLVKCTVMLADIGEWGAFNDVYKTYFAEGRFPARAAFGANGLAVGARVEVDCVGAK